MRRSSSTIRAAARVAAGQHGVVTRPQLLAAGVGESAVERWLAKGLLHRVHPGVYRLGHRARSTEASYLAAVLAAGAGAGLCGFAAAYLLDALGRRPPAPEITGSVDLRLRGVIVRRLAPLHPDDVRTHHGIPATTPARTIVDLAGRASFQTLKEVSHRLRVLHGLGAADVLAVMQRRGRVNGAHKLRSIYEGDALVLLSELERRFVALLDKAGIPLPVANRKKGSYYVDCRWPGLTVELLGYRFHSSRKAWEDDQRRQREAYARGDAFRTYTWDDVTRTPEVVLAELAPLLLDRAA